MTSTNYSVSFARRGLLQQQSLLVAELYLALKDWSEVRRRVLTSNLLQTRTQSTAKKLCTELMARLKTLSADELDLLVSGTQDERCYLLWLALCKRYSFIFDLAVEVLREKYLRMDLEISYEDYDQFFNRKAEWHDELASLSIETHKKVRQTVFQLMREARLLSKQNAILPVLLSSRLVQMIYRESKHYLSIFPLSDADARALAK